MNKCLTWDFFVTVLALWQVYSFTPCSFADSAPYPILEKCALKVATGSGFILQAASNKRYIITNEHVCNDSVWKGKLFAHYPNGTLIVGKVRKRDAKRDLCAAETDPQLPGLRLAKGLEPGETVFTRGYPANILTQSQGVVGKPETWKNVVPIEEVGECGPEYRKVYSSPQHRLEGCEIEQVDIMTTLYVRPGASGSPVVNVKGELCGVVSSWSPSNDFEGGMVPLRFIAEFIEGL